MKQKKTFKMKSEWSVELIQKIIVIITILKTRTMQDKDKKTRDSR